mgnify:CR=1 FL=1
MYVFCVVVCFFVVLRHTVMSTVVETSQPYKNSGAPPWGILRLLSVAQDDTMCFYIVNDVRHATKLAVEVIGMLKRKQNIPEPAV